MKTVPLSTVGEWINKLWYTCSRGYFPAVGKSEQTIDASKSMGESQKHAAEGEKPDAED